VRASAGEGRSRHHERVIIEAVQEEVRASAGEGRSRHHVRVIIEAVQEVR
jgi:hypothetical protein